MKKTPTICMKINLANIDHRTNAGIERLKKDYELKELDVGDLEEIPVQDDIYKVKQYEICANINR